MMECWTDRMKGLVEKRGGSLPVLKKDVRTLLKSVSWPTIPYHVFWDNIHAAPDVRYHTTAAKIPAMDPTA